MGDKSPKDNQKKNSQKQIKVKGEKQKQVAATTAKQSANNKKK